MQTKESQKKVCRKCDGAGHLLAYEAPHVVRKYCDCEIGRRRREFIAKQIETRDVDPVWELFTL